MVLCNSKCKECQINDPETYEDCTGSRPKINPLKWLKLHLITIPKQAKWERENEPAPTPQELKCYKCNGHQSINDPDSTFDPENEKCLLCNLKEHELKLLTQNKCRIGCFNPSTQNPKECTHRNECYTN